MKTCIIPTSSAEHIGKRLQESYPGANVLFLGINRDKKKFFPDGEQYTQIPDIELLEGERVVVIHSGMPDPDIGLIGLYHTLSVLKKPTKSKKIGDKHFEYTDLKKPASVEVFFTYFPYARQDKRFETGELIAAEDVFDNVVNHYGVKRVYTIDLHCADADWLKNYPVTNISASGVLKAAMEKDGYKNVVHMAPDMGAQERNGLKGLEKIRENSFEVKVRANPEVNVCGEIVVVDDDIISTGGTMVRARNKFLELGAKDVLASITHGVMADGIEKVKGNYTKLYLTNTIDRPDANVDISGLVWNTIKESGR